MPLNEHALACIHVHAFAIFDINNLKRAQTLDLHQLVGFKSLLHDIKHSTYKQTCIAPVHSLALNQHIS